MNPRRIPSLALAVIASLGLASLWIGPAEAQSVASVQVTNESTWLLDCKVTWNDGASKTAFNVLKPAKTSEKRTIMGNADKRILSCAKRNSTDPASRTEVEFHAPDAKTYGFTCAHADAEAKTGLKCEAIPAS